MEDRVRRPDIGSLAPQSPGSLAWGSSRSRTESPATSARRRHQGTDEMRIQVHDDGVVEFSVMLGANVDANQLAELVAAVRSSTRTVDGPASSPDLASLRRDNNRASPAQPPPPQPAQNPAPPTVQHPSFERHQVSRRIATRSATFTNIPPPRARTPPPRARSASQSPRLPDRALRYPRNPIPLLRSLPDPIPAVAPATIDHCPPSRRSVSTPDLRCGLAHPAADAVDAGGDALMADVRAMSFDLIDTNERNDSSAEAAVRGLPAPVATGRTHSPPGKMQQFIEDELSATWQGVEYELTEKYRTSDAAADPLNPKTAVGSSTGNTHRTFHSTSGETPLPSPPPRAPWRLLARMRRRRRAAISHPPADAARADAKALRTFGSSGAFGVRTRETEAANETLSLAFSTLLSREQAIAEVARFAKLRGNQVWRRAGEFKLRCLRKLSRSSEMHMSIVVEGRDSYNTVVVVRRSRSDRNRTEAWRYIHFYRDVMGRLSATGHHVVQLTPTPTSSLSFRPRS